MKSINGYFSVNGNNYSADYAEVKHEINQYNRFWGVQKIKRSETEFYEIKITMKREGVKDILERFKDKTGLSLCFMGRMYAVLISGYHMTESIINASVTFYGRKCV